MLRCSHSQKTTKHNKPDQSKNLGKVLRYEMKNIKSTPNKTTALLKMLVLTLVTVLVLTGSSLAFCKANYAALRKMAETQSKPVSVSAIEPNTCLNITLNGHNIYRIENTCTGRPTRISVSKTALGAQLQLFDSDLNPIDEAIPKATADGSVFLEIPMSADNGKFYFVDISHDKASSDEVCTVMYTDDSASSIGDAPRYDIGRTVHLSTKGSYAETVDGRIENFDATKGVYSFAVEKSGDYYLNFNATGECNYSFIIREAGSTNNPVYANSGILYAESLGKDRVQLKAGVVYHIFYNAHIRQGGDLEFSITPVYRPNSKS